ncbi:MAG: hypothetical protein COB41_04145 [Proteobacteria bacterium]|nr:MAG: hypothetical protein COB41_04145 [Pseudomonadota bacterium]
MTELELQEVEKVHDKIPKWFKNPEQINTRILLAYMNLVSKREVITVDLLKSECRGIGTFDINYPQMKNISRKNNAKVFHQEGDLVTLWKPVKSFIQREYEQIAKLGSSDFVGNLTNEASAADQECISLEDINTLWLSFNEYSNKLVKALGRTNNIVGEYAEYLTLNYYGGKFLKASAASSDIKSSNGKLIQVKARKVSGSSMSGIGLSIIRSWDFDFLVTIFFDASGRIKKVLEVPVEVAKEYGVENSHQHGWVITTNNKLLNDTRITDMTTQFRGYDK